MMNGLARYERALQLALRRMGIEDDAPGRYHIDLVEMGLLQGRALVQDIYRLVNIIEALEQEAGIQHVRLMRQDEGLARLEALGYQVQVYPEIGPRDGEARWVAKAFYEGRLVAQAYGDTKREAMRGLAGEVGVS